MSLSSVSYRHAQVALNQLRHSAGATGSELTTDLRALDKLQQKLDQRIVSIAAFGLVNRGKSTVINALLGQPRLVTGPLNGVTQSPQTLTWTLPGQTQGFRIRLIDTPGLNEVKGEARAQIARQVAQAADLILFVIAGDITQIEYQALLELRALQKPILLVFNKIDLYPDQDRQAIYAQITSSRIRQLVSPSEILLVAAAPTPVKVRIHWPDDRVTYEWEQPLPQIAPLRKKLSQILSREGESLIALNALLQAARIQERRIRHQVAFVRPQVQTLQWRGLAGKVAVIGLSPFFGVDLLVSLIADLGLVVGMARLVQLPLGRYGLTALLRRVALNAGILAGVELITFGLGNLELSWMGDGSAGLLQVLAVGLSSRSLMDQIEPYLTDASLFGSESPQTVAHSLLAQLDKRSILFRIRQEVSRQLQPGQRSSYPVKSEPKL